MTTSNTTDQAPEGLGSLLVASVKNWFRFGGPIVLITFAVMVLLCLFFGADVFEQFYAHLNAAFSSNVLAVISWGVLLLLGYTFVSCVVNASTVLLTWQNSGHSRPDWKASYRKGLKKAPKLFATGILLILLLVGFALIMFSILSVLQPQMNEVRSAFAFVAMLYMSVSLFWACYALVIPALLIEDLGIGAAFKRNRQLLKGNYTRYFGYMLLVFVLYTVLAVLELVGAELVSRFSSLPAELVRIPLNIVSLGMPIFTTLLYRQRMQQEKMSSCEPLMTTEAQVELPTQ